MVKPKVTIGVCVKNCEKTIRDAIESIMVQDYPHDLMEVIFVDDGSEDSTLSILKSYVPKMDMQVRIFHHKWRGLGYTRNLVVKSASGEYIIWVDADMILPRGFVRRQVEFMDEHPNVGIGKGIYRLHNENCLVAYLENVDALIELLDIKQENFKPLGTGGSIYRVEAIRAIGGFDENIKGVGEDMEAEHKIKKAGWLLKITPAEFYEIQSKNWRDLWNKYFWHGSGGRRIFNKVDPHSMLYKMFPLAIFLTIITRSCRAYKLVGRKVVFLLPIHWMFKRIAWFLGFVTGRY